MAQHLSGPSSLKGHVALIAKVADKAGLLRVFFPEWKIAHPEEVAVIHQEFLEASPGHIRELDLCFLGGAGRLAAFGYILFARAGGLHHLVDRAIAFFKNRWQNR